MTNKYPRAVVMNMFYTGLGIARSLGEHGIPVIGLTAHPRTYGNFTRYARIVSSPDSRNEPERLLPFLLTLAERLDTRAVLFPTRDDDVLFLDRYRDQLAARYSCVIPGRHALETALDKWETCNWAQRAGVPAPKCWLIDSDEALNRAVAEVSYPCVLKPVASFHWRQGANWEKVQGRKAIGIRTPAELSAEYSIVRRAAGTVLLQEMVSGPDSCLAIAACYVDRESRMIAGFNTRKVVQSPEHFGTGCIVQAADCPELFDPTVRLLESIGYSGIAEVEYKWDEASAQYKLIEVNPRPWDQHRLGKGCGVDLVHIAYCDHAGVGMPHVIRRPSAQKWVAEDATITEVLRLLWNRDRKVFELLKHIKGDRIYGIWSARDPLPFLVYMGTQFLPKLLFDCIRAAWKTMVGTAGAAIRDGSRYGGHAEKNSAS